MRTASARHRLEQAQGRLAALSPLQVLARGYAVVQHPDGRLIRTTGEVLPGQSILIRLTDGRLLGRVEEVCPNRDTETR